jgi:protein involved in polysaccharide export with SLBB domain
MKSARVSTIHTAMILAAAAGLCLAGCRSSHRRRAPDDANAVAKEIAKSASADDEEAASDDPNAALIPYGGTDGKPAQKAPRTQTSGPRDVLLRAGDVLEVKFFYTPELDVTQSVRPDGKIALQLVGEVPVEGKTPAQVRDLLLTLYDSHLKDPKITILLKSQYDRRVFVTGEVVRPGMIQMPGDMTAAEAIMEAGGFDMDEARLDSVIVIRQTGGRWQGFKTDMKSTMEGEGMEPFYLHPRDIVYVPRTKIAKVDLWIEQHINKLIPRIPVYFSVPNND